MRILLTGGTGFIGSALVAFPEGEGGLPTTRLECGLTADIAGAATFDATGADVYRQGVASSVAQSSTRILDRFLNLLPTVTIREGHRIKVYLSGDLELPAYRSSLTPIGGRP